MKAKDQMNEPTAPKWATGFELSTGYCDQDCQAAEWLDDRCVFMLDKSCQYGCGKVWVKSKNSETHES